MNNLNYQLGLQYKSEQFLQNEYEAVSNRLKELSPFSKKQHDTAQNMITFGGVAGIIAGFGKFGSQIANFTNSVTSTKPSCGTDVFCQILMTGLSYTVPTIVFAGAVGFPALFALSAINEIKISNNNKKLALINETFRDRGLLNPVERKQEIEDECNQQILQFEKHNIKLCLD